MRACPHPRPYFPTSYFLYPFFIHSLSLHSVSLCSTSCSHFLFLYFCSCFLIFLLFLYFLYFSLTNPFCLSLFPASHFQFPFSSFLYLWLPPFFCLSFFFLSSCGISVNAYHPQSLNECRLCRSCFKM